MANRRPRRGKRFKSKVNALLLPAILFLEVISAGHVTAPGVHPGDRGDASDYSGDDSSGGDHSKQTLLLRHLLDEVQHHHPHHHPHHHHHHHHHHHQQNRHLHDRDHHHHHHRHLRLHRDDPEEEEESRDYKHLREEHYRHHHQRQGHQSPHRHQSDDDDDDDEDDFRYRPYQTTHEPWKNPCGPEEPVLPEATMETMSPNDGGPGESVSERSARLEAIILKGAERLKRLYRAVLEKFVNLRLDDSIADESYARAGGSFNNMSDVIDMTSSVDNETSFGEWLSASYVIMRRIESLTLETVKDEERVFSDPFIFTSDYIRLLDDTEGGIRFILCAIHSSPSLDVEPGSELATFGLSPAPSNTLRRIRDYCFLRDSYDVVGRLFADRARTSQKESEEEEEAEVLD